MLSAQEKCVLAAYPPVSAVEDLHPMRDIFSVMPKSSVADTAKAIADMIDTGTDLTWRYLLINRKDLSASATLVLNRVNQEGPMRLTALAAAEDTSQPAMTQLVQRMERQGLLERLSDPEDGRAALVAISQAGLDLWQRRTDGRRERLANLLGELSSDDAQTLLLAAHVAMPILRKLVQIAGSQAASAEAPR
ncbi:MAG TPA: MarR family transcriptional regulator [Mycobacterium sp.]|nr:MarR family transcriptional regulator [Mycobacterium sp.]